MFEVTFSDKAFQQLKKLEWQVQERIISGLERIRIRPAAYVQRLVGDSAYKFRVGDYRVILEIDPKKSQIIILKVGHRKNVYDKL